MLILPTAPPVITTTQGLTSPLNGVWLGSPRDRVVLPQLGHLLLLFPLGETAVSLSHTTIPPAHYMLLTPTQPVTLNTLTQQAHILVLWLSPAFIGDMADFLNIPDNLQGLLQGIPLLQGDQMSELLLALAAACQPPTAPKLADDLFLEVVGEVLHLMRLRHQTLLSLAKHKPNTIADLLPRLMQARQFVEARYLEAIKLKDVADYAALSEFHFARLFKAAFDITLRQHIIRLRLDTARRLLEQPQARVTETALQVGYQSLSSFIHAFAKRFGLSPSQYQTQMKMAQDLTSPQPDGSL